MTGTTPPNQPQQPGQQPAPQQASYPPPMPAYPQSEGRSVAFFVALFLGLLLLISGGINVVLVVFSAFGDAGGYVEGSIDDNSGAGYKLVAVEGSKAAKNDQILRIRVNGAIAEGSSPLIGAQGGTVSQVRRELRLAARSDGIKAVLLEVNSPGGGVTDSDEIYRLIKQFKADTKKPVVAYFGDMSASGGYYIAAACDRIYCRATTITGSIGVIMSQYNLAGLFDKYGIKTETIISPDTPYKDIMSMSRDMKPEERRILTSIVQEMYERFVDVVDEGRPELSRDEVKALANGSIYSANQAQTNGLVDDVLNPDEVLDEVKKLAGMEKAQVVEQRRLPTTMEALFGTPGARAKVDLTDVAAQLLNQTTGSKLLYFWPGGR